jgi:GNAT superfamily N-acetyltransferase
MIIRPAQPSDCAAIARVHIDTNKTTYHSLIPAEILAAPSYEKTAQRWQQRLFGTDSTEYGYVAEIDSTIAGFICASTTQTNPAYEREIVTMYVLQCHQGKGIGSKLMRQVIGDYLVQGINSMLLWTYANSSARGFYQHLGGTIVDHGSIQRGDRKIETIALGWDNLRTVFS